MAEHLFKNWIVYVLIIGFVWFVVSVYRHAWREERNKQGQNKSQESNKEKERK